MVFLDVDVKKILILFSLLFTSNAILGAMEANKDMEEVYNFLKQCDNYFLATMDGNQPKVRPFGTAHIFEGKIYILTGKQKLVAQQIAKNHRISICALDTTGDTWLRIEADAMEDDRVVARKSMLDAYPKLRSKYNENDNNTIVYYLKNATATIETFSGEKRTFKF